MTNRRLDVLEDAGRVVPPRPPVVNLNPQPQVNHAAPNGQEVPVDFVAAQDNETWRRMVEGFMKMKPPKFSGSTDVTVVEDWKEDIENLFDAMGQASDLATLLEQDYVEHNRPNDNAKYGSSGKGEKVQHHREEAPHPPSKKQNTDSFSASTETRKPLKFHGTCYTCGRVGHKAIDCVVPERRWLKQDQGKSETTPFEKKTYAKELSESRSQGYSAWKEPTDFTTDKRSGQVYAIGQGEQDSIRA
ncbi:hypothetical protein FRX31_018037 [Thalictrum thalictroides]|uniref:CCHC-type domain-containing protein n=1 Tax=Thalictrum thalictroides TaxID=46969 RepID=A0A7J6W4S8_THATH|nr:hypothetical protein FRX31_018037 [Thalictrum thalictroides]